MGSTSDFNRAGLKNRETYSTDAVLLSIKDGIFRCLSRKNQPKFAGFDFLFQAPLDLLPRERWEAIRGDLLRKRVYCLFAMCT